MEGDKKTFGERQVFGCVDIETGNEEYGGDYKECALPPLRMEIRIAHNDHAKNNLAGQKTVGGDDALPAERG